MASRSDGSIMRIVSLLPSATEIVCALGGRDLLVGRSAECDFPSDVRSLPVVMRPRTLDMDRGSAEIDQRVRTAREAGESLYHLDIDLLARLRPDVVLTQDLCGVCSVTDREVERACRSAGVQPRILSESPTRLEEVWGSIERIGNAVGLGEAAVRLSRSLRSRSTTPLARGKTTRVAVVEWLDPPYLSGLWTPDIIRAADGIALGPLPGAAAQRTDWDGVGRLAPDLVLVSPCSFDVERTRREAEVDRVSDGLSRLAPANGVWFVDEAYFSRPGPRLADGVELIRALRDGRSPRGPMPAERRPVPPPEVAT